jgi:xanthine dehydrogenase accessory factor
MSNVWKAAIEHFDRGQDFVIATILAVNGSSPRHAGTRLLVNEAGDLVGTIGGGLFEARVCESASEALRAGASMRIYFTFKGSDVLSSSDMLCGGDADVLIERISGSDKTQESMFRNIWDIVSGRSSGYLFTRIDVPIGGKTKEPLPRLLLRHDGTRIGGFPQDAWAIEAAPPVRLMRSAQLLQLPNSESVIYLEWLRPQCTAYIFGGGHVGVCVAQLASFADFRVVVLDDRAEFANPERIPEADETKVLDSFHHAFAGMDIDDHAYVVIVTRGHLHDRTVLAEALRTPAGYIGMIGSRRKTKLILDGLLKEGFTASDLARVYAPIGIDIGGETPQEIAVSIVAEMISVRNGKARKGKEQIAES